MTFYIDTRIIDGKLRRVIVDKKEMIINKNPTKDELKLLTVFPEKDRGSKSRGKYYTKEQLLDCMRQFFKETGRVPIVADFDANYKYPNPSTYVKHFGSWINSLVLAELCKEDDKYKRYTDKELLDYLLQFKEETGRVPVQNDFVNNSRYPSYRPYDRLGGWNKSIEKAGLDIYVDKEKYTDKELLNYLLRFKEKNGRHPTTTDFKNNPRYPNLSTYIRHFGSWSNALKLAELDVDTMVMQGVLETTQQKGRKAEIAVIKHLKNPIDLSGENYGSPWDGICPNGMNYEVKSSGLRIGGYFQFNTDNKDNEEIEIYYFLAFNENYTKLIYGWRVPGEIVESNNFRITLDNLSRGKFTVENMKQYDIIEMLRDALVKYEFFK